MEIQAAMLPPPTRWPWRYFRADDLGRQLHVGSRKDGMTNSTVDVLSDVASFAATLPHALLRQK